MVFWPLLGYQLDAHDLEPSPRLVVKITQLDRMVKEKLPVE